MLIGWSILAVPIGIVGVELARSTASHARRSKAGNERTNNCSNCDSSDLDQDFKFCPHCGKPILAKESPDKSEEF